MNSATRRRVLGGVGAGLAALAVALLGTATVGGPGWGDWDALASAILGLLVVIGVVGAFWQLRARPPVDEPDAEAPVRRSGRYQLTGSPPEHTTLDSPLAGEKTAAVLDRAAMKAADAGRVEAGLAFVREPLRDLVEDLLISGGDTPAEAARALATGRWTDDPEAAAVLAPELDPPRRSFRQRFRAWVRPGQEARTRIDRTIGAISALAVAELPRVVGQTAPRQVSIPPPTLAELRRDVDGTLRPARTQGSSPGPPASADGGERSDTGTGGERR